MSKFNVALYKNYRLFCDLKHTNDFCQSTLQYEGQKQKDRLIKVSIIQLSQLWQHIYSRFSLIALYFIEEKALPKLTWCMTMSLHHHYIPLIFSSSLMPPLPPPPPSFSLQFDKAYAYGVRHMFGKEGKRADYTPYSCMKVILSNPPSQGDYHGELTSFEEVISPG